MRKIIIVVLALLLITGGITGAYFGGVSNATQTLTAEFEKAAAEDGREVGIAYRATLENMINELNAKIAESGGDSELEKLVNDLSMELEKQKDGTVAVTTSSITTLQTMRDYLVLQKGFYENEVEVLEANRANIEAAKEGLSGSELLGFEYALDVVDLSIGHYNTLIEGFDTQIKDMSALIAELTAD